MVTQYVFDLGGEEQFFDTVFGALQLLLDAHVIQDVQKFELARVGVHALAHTPVNDLSNFTLELMAIQQPTVREEFDLLVIVSEVLDQFYFVVDAVLYLVVELLQTLRKLNEFDLIAVVLVGRQTF